MKKLLISCMLVLAGLQIGFAQDQSERKSEIREQRKELMKERQNQSQETVKAVGLAALTAADVGEPDSFGRNAKFMGTASAGVIYITSSCLPADIGTLGPDDRCIEVTDPNIPVPSTTFNDIGRITIPGRSADNIIYAIANHSISFYLINSSGFPSQGRISYVPSVTIESDALNDPMLIDPDTNQPYNGSFTTTGFGTLSLGRALGPGETENQTSSYSRANTVGFSRTYFEARGLPNNVINQLYKKPMTIRLNVRISSRLVSDATIIYSMRFLGN